MNKVHRTVPTYGHRMSENDFSGVQQTPMGRCHWQGAKLGWSLYALCGGELGLYPSSSEILNYNINVREGVSYLS